MKKRILSSLLTLCMVLALLPGTARAEEETVASFDPVWPCESAWTIQTLYFYRYSYANDVTRHATRSNTYIPDGYLNAIDIGGNGNILAAEAGTIRTVSYDGGGFGNYIVIAHANGMYSLYGHLQSTSVSVGSSVTKGQVIGVMGSTGNSSGPHLHFELYAIDGSGNYTVTNPFRTYFEAKYRDKILIGTNSKAAAEKVLSQDWAYTSSGSKMNLSDAGREALSWYVELLNTYYTGESGGYYYNDGPHTHNFSTVEYEAAHPHKEYRKCSCGATEYTGNTVLVAGCDQCYPAEYTVSGQVYCLYEDGTEHLIPDGAFMLHSSDHSYTLPIQKGTILPGTKIAPGTYDVYITLDVNRGMTPRYGYCEGKMEDKITITGDTNLGDIKLPFYIIQHGIEVKDTITEEPLGGFDWELRKDGQRVDTGANVSEVLFFIEPPRVGSTYTLKIFKEGYLDLSQEFTPYLTSSSAGVRTITAVYLQPTQGDCGNGVQWRVEDGVLTFWGNGPIPDSSSVPPWGELGRRGLIEHVEIMPGITRIGDRTMYGGWDYEGITASIPDTVTSIGEVSLAFTSLRYLEIPKSVTAIEYEAFDYSKDLTIKFMGDAPELSTDIFTRCTGITILYPAGNSTWDEYIGQNLGADDNVTWQPYGQEAVVPTPMPIPTPAPVTPVTPSQPADSGKPAEPDTSESPAALTFADVRTNDWYYEAVEYVTVNGLMTGTGPAVFAPNGSMTRAMVWTVLARMGGEDVDGGSPWYGKAQAWALAGGVSDGTGPDDSITREQLVTMLYRYAGSPSVGASELALLSRFTDGESVSGWAREAAAWAAANGILTGDGGALAPQGSATRAQVAAILARFCQLSQL